MSSTNKIARRDFLRHTGLSGLALILGVSSVNNADAADIRKMSAGDIPPTGLSGLGDLPGHYGITPYISIEPSGKITIINPKPEMGQGTWQSIPSLIAEELEVFLDQVTIINSSGQKEIPGQSAGGSSSVRGSYASLRKVGASARE